MDYYIKYLKYKSKYLKLKGGEKRKREYDLSNNIVNEYNKVYYMFTTSKLLERVLEPKNMLSLEQHEKDTSNSSNDTTDKPKKVVKTRFGRLSFSPERLGRFTQPITEILQKKISQEKGYEPEEASEILEQDIENIYKDNDESYDKNFNAKNYGKVIEAWIADNMICPVCEQNTLRRYAKSNFPIIDLVCINSEHKHSNGVKFFQVKASNGSRYNNEFYFSKELEYIYIGNSNYSKLIHLIDSIDIKTNTDLEKLLIGYICIQYTEMANTLKINNNNSFIVLPKIGVIPFNIFEFLGSTIYNYYEIINDNKIKFNDFRNEVKPININEGIDINYLSNNEWHEIDNRLIN